MGEAFDAPLPPLVYFALDICDNLNLLMHRIGYMTTVVSVEVNISIYCLAPI